MSENGQKMVEIPASMSVRDLAEAIDASPIDVIKQLMANGVMANINQQIDFDTAAIVMAEFGYEAQLLDVPEEERKEDQAEIPQWRQLIENEPEESLEDRAPIVTILGHVDHGKTTLLDAIRETDVAEGEAGGITQHIGAYQIHHNGRIVTFLDTPGHAAFTAMRARGAQGADIAVLVVAADDGMMPQTREALAHARAASVPIVVAINKIDRDSANLDVVKKQLSDAGLVPDDWEGDTMVVPVSAKERTGIDDLVEAILLVADDNEIKANPNGQVYGTVIEAEIDKFRGIVSTLLVQSGTLGVGSPLIAGTSPGKIKAMFDYQGNPIKEAGPSTPVSVLGISDIPEAGELFIVVDSEREARMIASKREAESKRGSSAPQGAMSLEEIFEAYQAGKAQELLLVIRADVQGSLEPIVSSVTAESTDEITVRVLHAETGNIGESDVMLAAASGAIVIGFNVEVDQTARKVAEKERVDIRTYDIIYRLTEDVEKALKGMLEPEIKRVKIGRAEVRALFKISKTGTIAGCRVLEGEIRRNSKMVVIREDQVIFDSVVRSLKHEKDDVREVREGFECGIGIKGFEDFEEGDILEAYVEESVPVT